MKKITIAALLLTACITHAAPAYTNAWDVDLARNPHTIIDVWRGESIALTPRTGLAGLPDDAEFRWQTPDMGNLFWVTNATVSASGDMTVEWLPEMDNGSITYFFFFRGGGLYRPRGTIRMQGSPGAEPNTLPLPGRVLDFATITVTNAPWATPADLDAAISNIPPVVETDPVALPIATQALGLAQSITLDSLGGVTNTAPTIYGPLRIEGPVPRLYIQGPSPRITISDTATSKAVELQMSRFFWGPNAMYSADFPSANGTFALEGYADQAASLAVTAHNSSASAHASLFSGLASETWVTATRAKWSDIATNVVYQVVVSNGHWLIKEVQ